MPASTVCTNSACNGSPSAARWYAAAASSVDHRVTTSQSSPWRAVVRRMKPGWFGTSSVCTRRSSARNDSSVTPSASLNVVTSTIDTVRPGPA